VTSEAVADQAIEDSRHDEICYTSTSVTQATSKRVGSADNVFVEKASGPHLARYEAATEDTDEEAQRHETRGIVNSASEESRDSTCEQTRGKGVSGTNLIAHGTSNQSDK
jgi:hypothetical protein